MTHPEKMLSHTLIYFALRSLCEELNLSKDDPWVKAVSDIQNWKRIDPQGRSFDDRIAYCYQETRMAVDYQEFLNLIYKN